MTATQLRDHLIKALREYGFTVDSKETTQGASKVWMTKSIDDGESFSYESFLEAFEGAVPERKPRIYKGDFGSSILAKGFEAELQGYRRGAVTAFIAVYRKNQAGLEYEMGVDC